LVSRSGDMRFFRRVKIVTGIVCYSLFKTITNVNLINEKRELSLNIEVIKFYKTKAPLDKRGF